jgi:hypothetical protein
MNRRDFLKYGLGGGAVLLVGAGLPGIQENSAYGAIPVVSLNFTITDAIKEMVTHNATNTAECYFWVFKEARLPEEVPGPQIFATAGTTIHIRVHNMLDENHAFSIPDLGFTTGPIQPGSVYDSQVFPGSHPPIVLPANSAGTYLYYDNLNAPVNRVMGLHGALVVMPAQAQAGHKWTPYSNPTPQVQQLFDDLGTADHWPGLGWEDGDPVTKTPAFRQYVWLMHQASAALFRAVGSLPAGVNMSPVEFVQRFTNDDFRPNSNNIDLASDLPQYFSISGQSGHFGHNNPVICPMSRVGEPVIVRVLNAGLMTHSVHLHCNHYYVISVDGVVQGAPVGVGADNATLLRPGVIWVDTFTLNPMGYPSNRYDMVIPYMRAPDVPNERGIGRGGSGDEALLSLAGTPVWPPAEEFDYFTPASNGSPLHMRESPLCYPMHDHSEPSQTSQGGNYNCGLIAGMYVIGDRNINLPHFHVDDLFANPGEHHDHMPALPPQTFPMDMDFAMMLGLDQDPQILVYGSDEAMREGLMGSSRDSDLHSVADRPAFPVI